MVVFWNWIKMWAPADGSRGEFLYSVGFEWDPEIKFAFGLKIWAV